MKQSWITRNQILLSGKPHRFSLSVTSKSSFRLICETEIFSEPKNRASILGQIRAGYLKAPFFNQVFPLLEKIILNPEKSLSLYLEYSLKNILDYLALKTPLVRSSRLEKVSPLKGQERVISICKSLGANHYINSIGGKELYDRRIFHEHGIKLSFLRPRHLTYPQFADQSFVSNLSVIDALMFVSPDHLTNDLLTRYSLE